jgi:hypothetical protein
MINWFDTSGLVPHGFCLAWQPGLMAGWVIAHAVIAFAYFLIAGLIAWTSFLSHPPIPRWLLGSFAAFIFLCGLSHVMDDVTLYVPLYRLQVPELAITAAVSLITAVALFGIRIDRTRD